MTKFQHNPTMQNKYQEGWSKLLGSDSISYQFWLRNYRMKQTTLINNLTIQNEDVQVMNQLTKFKLKWTIDHKDLFLGWKWLIHSLQFLLLSFLLFSLFLSKPATGLFLLCIPRSESWTKMSISYRFCWVWHMWAILHMRGNPTQHNFGMFCAYTML